MADTDKPATLAELNAHLFGQWRPHAYGPNAGKDKPARGKSALAPGGTGNEQQFVPPANNGLTPEQLALVQGAGLDPATVTAEQLAALVAAAGMGGA
jgi:hypothetical protein